MYSRNGRRCKQSLIRRCIAIRKVQYTLIKLPIKELIAQNYNVTLDRKQEIERAYLIKQGDSLLFDQIRRLRGSFCEHIHELILVVAKKNPRQEEHLRHILDVGFTYNGVHYSRFGKSASQGKEGITAFICDSIYDELYRITQMDIPIEECVISKYEAQRCLPFSSCTLIQEYMPNIVIIGEYEKILPDQLIKYVAERERELTDRETGEIKTYTAREIEEGRKDLKLSPFDGCGCHEQEFMEQVSAQLGLDYNAIGVQVRLPFIKGYSVYVPFRRILKEWGYRSVTDIYGHSHPIDTIDCIWNISMFKGHKLFLKTYGDQAWNAYMDTVRRYQFKLGISKYSHHVKRLNRYTRMNFQYLQCLDLWNPNYVACFENRALGDYDILDSKNDGKIISLAKYTTALFEKIIKGEKFYTYKFMGITDSEKAEPDSIYLEAALLNDRMLKDPAVKQFIYRKLKKYIDEAKVGKIYCSGFYHTGVGDMIGYLQYAVGENPTGCLKEREIYSGNFPSGDLVSFRSPLVDPSEVNRIRNVNDDTLRKWFGYMTDQDIVMFNMHDLSAPQQGGADFDGDIFFLCDDPMVIDSKIDKRIILDIQDKATAISKPYTKENLIEYEVMTRDSRIGEITNAATSIENRYTTNDGVKTLYSDYASLLRIMQGKEIDFLKTGFRWQMNRGLRKEAKQLPYFLLYSYPDKLQTYHKLRDQNKGIEKKEDKLALNAYHSPSPMNELCDYVCCWERKHILWDRGANDLADTKSLILDHALDLSDPEVIRIVRRAVNEYADEIHRHFRQHSEKANSETAPFAMEEIVKQHKQKLADQLNLEEKIIANYVIKVSYSRLSISKSLAWSGYGNYIIGNIKHNSNSPKHVSIKEVSPQAGHCYEYLGKYYELKEADEDG